MMYICPVCKSEKSEIFSTLTEMPVSIGVQWATRQEALDCSKGDLTLAFCASCGFIWNHAFDPNRLEYSQRYDNSLDFSSVFQDYAHTLAGRLIDTYGVRGKEVIELGCGKGHFLTLLCEEGDNRGIGFDPSYEGDRVASAAAGRIQYIQDFYGKAYTHHHGDLICCRHVFEHIAEPVDFLSMVHETIGDRHSAIVYFEVPNVRFILEQHSIWDVIYEHCNYFSIESLATVFERSGFEILSLQEAYGGQFLSLEARLTEVPDNAVAGRDISKLRAAVALFSEQVQAKSDAWATRMTAWKQTNSRAVVWGGGAKAVSFLNMLKIGDAVPYVVDINPHKQGLYMPGTGQRIVSPDFLSDFQPQFVVLMNPIYRQEVEAQLKALGVDAEVIPA